MGADAWPCWGASSTEHNLNLEYGNDPYSRTKCSIACIRIILDNGTFDMKRLEFRSSGSLPGRQYPKISTAARILLRSSSSYSRRSDKFIFENGPTAKAI